VLRPLPNQRCDSAHSPNALGGLYDCARPSQLLELALDEELAPTLTAPPLTDVAALSALLEPLADVGVVLTSVSVVSVADELLFPNPPALADADE
jgi:hypothetical protein